jgi:insertion element IS1 protein InsB
MDEQWSSVAKKSNPRGLWYAIDHESNTLLAYVFGKRQDSLFKALKTLLEPLGIVR